MSELHNYPFVNQLDSKTLDGRPDENRGLNCVPSSIASGLEYLTRRPFVPDQLKDYAYGQGYAGGTAAVDYVTFCAKQGVQLSPVNGNPAYLVSEIHRHIQEGHPVIGTIPAPSYPPANRFNPGMSHVIAFYSERPGVLTAMNPWRAFSQPETDQWWQDRLCFGQIWYMYAKGNTRVNTPQGWQITNNILYAPNKVQVQKGFMQYVLAHTWHPDDLPLEAEHADGHGTSQLFCSRELSWNATEGVHETYLGPEVMHTRHTPPPAPVPVPVPAIPVEVEAAIVAFKQSLVQFAGSTSAFLKAVK